MAYTVSDLIIYPVKSLGGIHLQSCMAEAEGLQYDRRWMLVDPAGNFLTQRQYPQMCLFRLKWQEDGFAVTHAQYPGTFVLPFDEADGPGMTVTVWDDTIQAARVSAGADAWFSERMQAACRLVRVTDATSRKVDPRYAQHNETTGFSDGFPVLIIGEASLENLNAQLTEPVPMNRFRPNIVFSGGNAFDEDNWEQVSTASAVLQVVKPCARCMITTIDQQTGTGGKEPLKTLAGYRSVANKILFGQNALVMQPGIIRVGDVIRT